MRSCGTASPIKRPATILRRSWRLGRISSVPRSVPDRPRSTPCRGVPIRRRLLSLTWSSSPDSITPPASGSPAAKKLTVQHHKEFPNETRNGPRARHDVQKRDDPRTPSLLSPRVARPPARRQFCSDCVLRGGHELPRGGWPVLGGGGGLQPSFERSSNTADSSTVWWDQGVYPRREHSGLSIQVLHRRGETAGPGGDGGAVRSGPAGRDRSAAGQRSGTLAARRCIQRG